MFKKLRWRFMWVSTLVLLLVICAVMVIVYWISTDIIASQARFLMEEILENGGEFPTQGGFDPQEKPFLALNEESIYETRYFVAQVSDGDAQITHAYIAIGEETAIGIAESVYQKESDYGSLPILANRRMKYMKQEQEDGSTLIVVLDSTSRYGLIRIIMTYMSVLWLAVLVLYLMVMGRYSGKLVKPFIENVEKQKRFITNASHELKTPLAVISANTEMTEAMGGKTRWTESTRRQVGKLQTLIEDLVVLSRLDEIRDIPLTEMDLSALTSETAESFRDVIEDSGKHLIVDIAPGVRGKAERRSFQQLVSILMDNASKYCDEEGVVKVVLTSRRRARGARLTISNTYAEGKDMDYTRFFERFYREDASHNSARAGFGIGLSMGKEIVERSGGRIKASYAGDIISFDIEL